jgi:hypothetical protein
MSSAKLADELFALFPELQKRVSTNDETSSYLLMATFIAYLEELSDQGISEAILKRIIEFNSWCIAQPRGDADDDMYTILVVGLYEKIIRSDRLYKLIAQLVSRDDFVSAREYLLKWIDEKHYLRALESYASAT